ncbi:MAG: hypothetical protein AAF288_00835 [Planctomycetota bacterium]
MRSLSRLGTREELSALAWPGGAALLGLALSYAAARWTGSLGAAASGWAWASAMALLLAETLEARHRVEPSASTRRAALLASSAPLWLALLGAASTFANGLWDLVAGPTLAHMDRAMWVLILAGVLGLAGGVASKLLGPPPAPSGASPLGPLAMACTAAALAAVGAGLSHYHNARWEPALAILAWAVALPWAWRLAWRRFDAATQPHAAPPGLAKPTSPGLSASAPPSP